MSKIKIEDGVISYLHTFTAKGEFGLDIYICDMEDGNETYYQVVVYGERARSIYQCLRGEEHVTISGILAVRPYKTLDGKDKVSLIIKNADTLYLNQSRSWLMLRDQDEKPTAASVQKYAYEQTVGSRNNPVSGNDEELPPEYEDNDFPF